MKQNKKKLMLIILVIFSFMAIGYLIVSHASIIEWIFFSIFIVADLYMAISIIRINNSYCIGCSNCIRCDYCDYCVSCVLCKSCINCRACIKCKHCTNCVRCVGDCYYCKSCVNCEDCIRCKDCTSCVRCAGLIGKNGWIDNEPPKSNKIKSI